MDLLRCAAFMEEQMLQGGTQLLQIVSTPIYVT